MYSCPDCGGNLWSIDNKGIKHYRCMIGHAYSENDLTLKQSESINQTLWVAVRMMENEKIYYLNWRDNILKKGLAN